MEFQLVTGMSQKTVVYNVSKNDWKHCKLDPILKVNNALSI